MLEPMISLSSCRTESPPTVFNCQTGRNGQSRGADMRVGNFTQVGLDCQTRYGRVRRLQQRVSITPILHTINSNIDRCC